MNADETCPLLVLCSVLFFILCRIDHRDSAAADRARRSTWAAWKTLHPELFTPGSKGDRIDRELHQSPAPAPPPAAQAQSHPSPRRRQLAQVGRVGEPRNT